MTSSKQMGAGCLILFGIPFLLAGLGVTGWGVHAWMLYAASGSWQRVPATVQDVEFVEHSDSDGDTYSVKATYAYTVGDKTYTGHRVDVMGGSSSSYGMHHRRYEELKAAHDSGKPVTALVDPHDPAQALLYREKDTWLLVMIPFGLVFAGAGVLVIGIGVVSHRRGHKLADIAATDGNRVWEARADWAAGRVRASTLKDMAVYWGFGIGLSLFMSVFVIAVVKESAPLFAKIIVGLFCLVAALMVVKALALTVRVLAQGTPELFLSEVPVVPGRTVLAAVRTHRPLEADRWQVRLQCFVPSTSNDSSAQAKEFASRMLHQVEQATGQHRSWRTSDWRGACACSLELQPAGDAKRDTEGRAMLPVSIAVPAGVPGTSLESSARVTWTLQVKARSFPVSFKADFDLPVFYADVGEIQKTAKL